MAAGTKTPPPASPRFAADTLAATLDDADTAAAALPPIGEAQAAVLVPVLAAGEGAPTLVLTRRHADLRRHGGEISFPGGRAESADANLIETALRETEEEIGLRRGDVMIAGALPRTSTFVTGYAIHPFVGVLRSAASWTPSPLEVDEILELPLLDLIAARRKVELTRRGVTFETDAFVLGGETIWGATARIVEELLRRIEPLLHS
jgi:8-oxo-dGTP pyrophosphatase MutT (NUDIX family)